MSSNNMGEQGREEDIVLNLPAGEEGCLVVAEGWSQGGPKPSRQNFAKQPVVGIQKGNGPIGGRVSEVSGIGLGEGGDGALVEAMREVACRTDGSKEVGQEGGPTIIAHAPQRVRQLVGTWGGT